MLEADGVVFIVSEYNGGFPGILKFFYDYLPFPKAIQNRPICLIGVAAGRFGALRATEQFQNLISYSHGIVFSPNICIPRVEHFITNYTQPDADDHQLWLLLQQQATRFISFIQKLKQ